MKCEKCQQRDATIHLTQTRQGQTSEHHLCEPCAREIGIGHNLTDYFGTIGNLFGSGLIDSGSVFHTTGGIPAFGAAASRNITCPVCGQTYDDFRHSGLFGCSHCYEAFADRLDPVFRRVQGGVRHIGRKVCTTAGQQEEQILQAKLQDLKKTLKQTVQDEAYEKAARLRDEIHALENRLCAEGGESK